MSATKYETMTSKNCTILFIVLLFFGCNNKKIDGPVVTKVHIDNIITCSNYESPLKLYVDDENKLHNCTIILNNQEIQFTNPYLIEDAGFYSLIIRYPVNTIEDDTLIFVVLDKDRGEAEWGLKKWTPATPEYSNLSTEKIKTIYPLKIPEGIPAPLIFKVIDGDSIKKINVPVSDLDNQVSYTIKNGILALNSPSIHSQEELNFAVQNNEFKIKLTRIYGEFTEPENYQINGQYVIDSGKTVIIRNDLTITDSSALFVLPGSNIIIDEGINIYNRGKIMIQGTSDAPVLITCSKADKYWGGIISDATSSEIAVRYCFICRSGFHDTPEYQYGHAARQALFYLENSKLEIKNSYIIDNIGQIFYSYGAELALDSIIVSGAKTGGQINSSVITISNSFFTDFPDYSQIYQDEDNDCLYLHATDATITSSVFMYAKDDGIDTGGDSGGEINISGCLFEAMFHEGLALSSANDAQKNHYISNCTFINCGQGIELGYSSPNHSVYIDHCLLEYNLIGIRYGDNYPWSVQGNMFVSNTFSINNLDKDVWNMVRSNWSPFIEKMHFENTTVSKPVPAYPGLNIISN